MRQEAADGSSRIEAPIGEAPYVLVVDDDDRLRELLRQYLSDNGYRVSTAKDAAEARAKLGGIAFDLIVLDVMMPGESGVELTRNLRQSESIPILLLTAMGEAEDRIGGLESGADDYLTKPFEPRELLLRIATILRRTRPAHAPATIVRLGEAIFDPERDELVRGDEVVRLTTTEAGLLRAFSRSLGATLSREELCRQTGVDRGGRTIDVQVTRLRRKIEPDPRSPRYLHTVWGEGYVLRPD